MLYLILVFLVVNCPTLAARVKNTSQVESDLTERNVDLSFGRAKRQLR